MDRQIIQRAVMEAQHELAETDRELEALKTLMEKRNRLLAYIEHARVLLNGNAAEPSEGTTEVLTVDYGNQPLWASIGAVLMQNRKPMSVPQITRVLQDAGMPKRKHSGESVRTAMGRRDDIFEKVGPGLYALKSWSREVKLGRAEAAS